MIEVAYLSEQFVKSDWDDTSIEGKDQRLVFHVEGVDDVGDELVVVQGFAGRRELVGERSHVCEEGGHGLCALLRVGECRPDVVDAGQRGRREHLRQRRPQLVCMDDRRDLHEHFLREVIQEISQYLLILPDPHVVERIWDGLLLAILVLGDDDFGRLGCASINIPEETSTLELRRDLGAPEDVVGAGEALGDLAREGCVGGAGGGYGRRFVAMEELDEMEEVGSDYHVRGRRTLSRAKVACYIERVATPV